MDCIKLGVKINNGFHALDVESVSKLYLFLKIKLRLNLMR